MNIPLLEIQNISINYQNKNPIISNLNFSMNHGEKTLLIGNNGSGKSTLIQVIAGLFKPQTGQVLINGQSTLHEKTRQVLGFLPQNVDSQLHFPITILEVILMGGIGYLSLSRNKEYALQLLDLLKISAKPNCKIGDLSGGERRRVLIARALYCKPQLLLLDEPSAGLDSFAKKQLFQILKNLDVGLLMSTHAVDEFQSIATHSLKLTNEKVST